VEALGGLMTEMPIATLKSGLRVGNFSSPHAFSFNDGTVLPACAPERVDAGSLEFKSSEVVRGLWTDLSIHAPELTPSATQLVAEAYALWKTMTPDTFIVIVPRSVLEAIKLQTWTFDPTDGATHPFRTGKLADRKAKINHSDRFCA
jgi:hypothetical protein